MQAAAIDRRQAPGGRTWMPASSLHTLDRPSPRGGRAQMFPSAVLFAFGGTLLVADAVPTLDVEAGCRAAAKMGSSLSLDESLRQCLSDEKSARGELERQWSEFPPALRQRCVGTTETG